MDLTTYYQGKAYQAYEFLGVHLENNRFVFRVYAPNSHHVSLIGSFSSWNEIPMYRILNGQFFEVKVDAKENDLYKFRIYINEKEFMDHIDPYAFYSETLPGNASKIFISHYQMKYKKPEFQSLNIYEIQVGSFKDEIKSYQDLKEIGLPYIIDMGYNAIELMPINEYPNDQSWGYQATGYFSPTSRYGNPDDLKEFIDTCHKHEIKVIADYVPVHFALDDYGLKNFDGTCLYEYPHKDVGESEWGSMNFIHSRPEVQSFLLSSAYYYLNELGFDGLRYDAVSNLIYWQGDKNRGENLPAIQFIRQTNQILKEKIPNCLLIAEDSSNYGKTTKSINEGGLGFDYKWDLGWMNDTLDFFSKEYQEENYHKLTFSMYYFYNEKYLLPLSHDEVVHGKKTIIDKMNGEYEEKFERAKILYLYMMTHPGVKLNFMGNEIAQFREWDEKRGQDFMLLDYPIHQAFQTYIQSLNHLYKKYPELWINDYQNSGFEWENCHLEKEGVYVYKRINKDDIIYFFMNVSNKDYTYTLTKGHYELLIETKNIEINNNEIHLPKQAAAIYKYYK